MNRRRFLGSLLAAPVAAKVGVLQELAEATSTASAQAAVGATELTIGANTFGYELLKNPVMRGLYAAGLLPEWAKQEILQEARGRRYQMDPNIYGLRSVSTTMKHHIARRRAEEVALTEAGESMVAAVAREAFIKANGSLGGPV